MVQVVSVLLIRILAFSDRYASNFVRFKIKFINKTIKMQQKSIYKIKILTFDFINGNIWHMEH